MKTLGWHSLDTSFECECGQTHSIPIKVCHIGTDAADKLAEYAKDNFGSQCLLVADETTKEVGGGLLIRALRDAGKNIREKVFESGIEATLERAEDTTKEADGVDFVVALGSGTVSDFAKYAGDKLGLPVLIYATAASMNGYTSPVVAMKVRGLKTPLPCVPAVGVFGDPEVCATAPQRMTAAGVGDFLSKGSSGADWFAGNLFRGEYYCKRPREFFDQMQDALIDAAPKTAAGDTAAVGTVLEALCMSGLSMVMAGTSAPSSGGEHLISHYMDMKHAQYGTANDLHGAQVGVGVIYCAGLWRAILDVDVDSLDFEALVDAQPSEEQIREWIYDDWGKIAPEVHGQWLEKAISRDEMLKELQKFKDNIDMMRDHLVPELLAPETVIEAVKAAGGPTTPEELDVPVEEYRKAVCYSRFLRNRFVVLDLAAELCLVPQSF